MKRKTVVPLTLGIVLFLVYIIYSSLTVAQVSCEACIEFQGRKECRSAAAANLEEAQRAATDLACVFLASGRTDSIACSNTRPSSMTCTER
jgi:hypothetical protein